MNYNYQVFLDGLYNSISDDTDEYQPGDVLIFNPLLKSDEKKYNIKLITDDFVKSKKRDNKKE